MLVQMPSSPQLPSSVARSAGGLGAGGFFIPGSGMPGTNEFPSTYYPSQQHQYPPQSPGLPSPYTGGFVIPDVPSTPGHQPAIYPPIIQGSQPYPYGSSTSVPQLLAYKDTANTRDSDHAQGIRYDGSAPADNMQSVVVTLAPSSKPGMNDGNCSSSITRSMCS